MMIAINEGYHVQSNVYVNLLSWQVENSDWNEVASGKCDDDRSSLMREN